MHFVKGSTAGNLWGRKKAKPVGQEGLSLMVGVGDHFLST